MPTFQFYKNSKLVLEVTGADRTKILQGIAQFK
jgi:hypothetical protein